MVGVVMSSNSLFHLSIDLLFPTIGITLFIAGGASNLFDAFKQGFVVDWIVILKRKQWMYTVNIADLAIYIGILLYIVSVFGQVVML
jgi:lipoprotein signal peptidase